MMQTKDGDYIVLPSDLPRREREVGKSLYQQRLAGRYDPFPNPGHPAEDAAFALKETGGKALSSLRRIVGNLLSKVSR